MAHNLAELQFSCDIYYVKMFSEAICLATVIAFAMEIKRSSKQKRKQNIWMKKWLKKRCNFSYQQGCVVTCKKWFST